MKVKLKKVPTLAGAGQPIHPSNNHFNRCNRSISKTRYRGKSYKLFGFLDIKIVIIVLTLGGGLGFTSWRVFTGKAEHHIISWKFPEPGGFVDQTNRIAGTIYPVPEGKSLWIFQQPSFGDAYPKRASIKINGEFDMPMPFGNTVHGDQEFQIYGIVLPAETHFREMDKMRVRNIPKGEKISPISVTRR